MRFFLVMHSTKPMAVKDVTPIKTLFLMAIIIIYKLLCNAGDARLRNAKFSKNVFLVKCLLLRNQHKISIISLTF